MTTNVIAQVLEEYHAAEAENKKRVMVIRALRGDEEPECFGLYSCTSQKMQHCPWSMDCEEL